MYHFGLIFTKREKENKRKLYIGYCLSFIFLLLTRTDYFVTGLYEYDWGFHTQARVFHHLFLVFFFSYITFFLSTVYNFLKVTPRTKEIEIKQVQYLFLSFLIMNGGAYAFLPAYGIDVNPIGAYFLEIIATLILVAAILKYHLFGIRVILTELLVGLMAILIFIFSFLLPKNYRFFGFGFFLLFCIFAYYLIKATYQEEKRRKKAERIAERERKLRLETERLMRAKDQFLLSTQHYFRTPLTSLIGYLDLLAEGDSSKKEMKERIKRALNSSFILRKRIEESLDISAFQSGKAILEKQEIQIEDLIEEVIEELRPQIEIKKLKLEIDFPKEKLPKIKVDKKRMREVFSNLIENAIKHTPQGSIAISLEKKEKGIKVKGESILFSVADTGIGISSQDLSYLGQFPFERGKEAKKLTPLGKGIGLYLSRLIVEAHGGKLWAESEGVGKGSTFFVELPSER
jgi:signal transduction histidine kinase